MELLSKVMSYFSKPKNLSPLQVGTMKVNDSSRDGAKAAAIAAALHHHSLEHDDARAKVAAIAVALHHHNQENNQANSALAGLASLVAAIHHHKTKKQI